jgi:hypothetical protein
MTYEIDVYKNLKKVMLYTIISPVSFRYLKTNNHFNNLFFLLNEIK